MILPIDVVSDVVCPWCFIGKRRLEKAIALRPDIPVEVRFRPYFLNPWVPREGISREEYLTLKFGSPERYRPMAERVAAAASEEGLSYRLDGIKRQPNTIDCHRLIFWAGEIGNGSAMKQRLMELYFAEGADLTDREVLIGAAAENGLDADRVRDRLGGEDDVAQVEREAKSAKQAGIRRGALFHPGRHSSQCRARSRRSILRKRSNARRTSTPKKPQRNSRHRSEQLPARETQRQHQNRTRGNPRAENAHADALPLADAVHRASHDSGEDHACTEAGADQHVDCLHERNDLRRRIQSECKAGHGGWGGAQERRQRAGERDQAGARSCRGEQNTERECLANGQGNRCKPGCQSGSEQHERDQPSAWILLADEETDGKQRQRMRRHDQWMQHSTGKATHAMPLRNANPATAIAPPAARTAMRPVGQRASRPKVMPVKCSNPVAATNPTK